MNIKLHTPKSLKAGSGMGSLKQFLLSLFATSVSIALTFGTAAIIDYRAKQKAKREIVMMYDMYTSLESVTVCDSNLIKAMELQLEIAEDTTKYRGLWIDLAEYGMPRVEFTETTERIFSSSIETINTVGNVLFTENVASFYQIRRQYKTAVCDSLFNELLKIDISLNCNDAINFKFRNYSILSHGFKNQMHRMFTQCQQMMDVSDEELKTYQKEREQIDKDSNAGQNNNMLLWLEKLNKLEDDIETAKKKLN